MRIVAYFSCAITHFRQTFGFLRGTPPAPEVRCLVIIKAIPTILGNRHMARPRLANAVTVKRIGKPLKCPIGGFISLTTQYQIMHGSPRWRLRIYAYIYFA